MNVFGPVPSRRLGRSLGINNIPFKYCTYSCIYCQLGLTNSMTVSRRKFYSTDEIFEETGKRLNELSVSGTKVDYLTLIPDGEPTLDINLGKTIGKLKLLGRKIAVVTNSSLLSDKDTRNEILNADWVSLKIDSAIPADWKKINRPHGCLDLDSIIEGLKIFAAEFKGELVTETMLVKDVNDSYASLSKTAEVIRSLNPKTAYILLPFRPPAEKYVSRPEFCRLEYAISIFMGCKLNVKLLWNDEGDDFSCTEFEKEFLKILEVHPMRIEAVEKMLINSSNKRGTIDKLISDKKIRKVIHDGREFIVKMR